METKSIYSNVVQLHEDGVKLQLEVLFNLEITKIMGLIKVLEGEEKAYEVLQEIAHEVFPDKVVLEGFNTVHTQWCEPFDARVDGALLRTLRLFKVNYPFTQQQTKKQGN